MSFEREVGLAVGKMSKSIVREAKDIVTFWYNSALELTPVDKGRLRGNWQPSEGSPLTGTIERTGLSGPREAIKRTVRGLGNYWLVNNLPYAPVAEYGRWSQGPYSTEKTTSEGFSRQAPQGMARITLLRTVARLRAKGFV